MAKPLEGIRVIDLTQYLAGPQATLFLAGLGAQVYELAYGYPALYGIAAIIIAILAGLAANAIFRNV